jgi:hypothetical protein
MKLNTVLVCGDLYKGIDIYVEVISTYCGVQ